MNRAGADGFGLQPTAAITQEQAPIGSAPQPAVGGLKQHAREIAFRVGRDWLDPQSVRVIAADATVCAEPRDAFAVGEDRIDAIRAQPADGALESKMLLLARIAITKRALRVRADPQIATPIKAQRVDRADAGIDSRRPH